MNNSGIYKITNSVNGKIYVGSAVDLRKRWGNHKSNLNVGINKSKHLQAAWNKYGQDSFEFSVIEYVEDKTKLIEREQYYIDTLSPEYNILTVAGSSLGYRHTEEYKAKAAEQSRGNRNLLGFVFSEESKAKMSNSAKGNSSHLGHKHTDEARKKMSEKLKGRIISEEVRRRMSIGKTGKPHPNWKTLKRHSVFYNALKVILRLGHE
jgi:group I intron endonuclease